MLQMGYGTQGITGEHRILSLSKTNPTIEKNYENSCEFLVVWCLANSIILSIILISYVKLCKYVAIFCGYSKSDRLDNVSAVLDFDD